MKLAARKGLGFGLTSGVITTLGIMIGLASSTRSPAVVMAGILVIAITDALSDAFAIHTSEETSNKSEKSVWTATIATFVSKSLVALLFIIPLYFLELTQAVLFSIVFGLVLISGLSLFIAETENKSASKVIGSHLLISIIVIVLSAYIGMWAESLKNTFV